METVFESAGHDANHSLVPIWMEGCNAQAVANDNLIGQGQGFLQHVLFDFLPCTVQFI